MSQDDEGDLSVAPRPLVAEHYIARGPKAVAVQRGTDLLAIGEGDRGGAVPRLHSGAHDTRRRRDPFPVCEYRGALEVLTDPDGARGGRFIAALLLIGATQRCLARVPIIMSAIVCDQCQKDQAKRDSS